MKVCVFAGSFDPITNGHVEVVKNGLQIFDKVIVAVGNNDQKTPTFTTDERVELISLAFNGDERVEVCAFNGLVVNFMKVRGVTHYIRGIRSERDLRYEMQAENFNKSHYPQLNTIFIPTVGEINSISSTQVKKLLAENKDVSEFVPKDARWKMMELYAKKNQTKN